RRPARLPSAAGAPGSWLGGLGRSLRCYRSCARPFCHAPDVPLRVVDPDADGRLDVLSRVAMQSGPRVASVVVAGLDNLALDLRALDAAATPSDLVQVRVERGLAFAAKLPNLLRDLLRAQVYRDLDAQFVASHALPHVRPSGA